MPLKLMKGIRHFKNHAYLKKRNLFTALTGGQSPDILFITCSDSRIVPSLITNSELGELFVIRNAGNIVPPYVIPSGEAATIEYALQKLKVKEIIICGHSHCGAMQGLLTPGLSDELPAVASWLKHAHPTLDRLREKHPSLPEDLSVKVRCATKENVLVQIENLKTHPRVKEKLDRKELNLHAWFYEFESGEILIYDWARGDFISFEDAVTEAFEGEYILKKMAAIVEEEALRYLATQASPETLETYHELMHIFQELKKTGVGVIWEKIKENVTARLWSEFGELCDTRLDSIDPRFAKLLTRCLEVKLSNLQYFQKDVSESKGYHQFCSHMIRQHLMGLSPTPTEALESTLGISYL